MVRILKATWPEWSVHVLIRLMILCNLIWDVVADVCPMGIHLGLEQVQRGGRDNLSRESIPVIDHPQAEALPSDLD